MATDLKKFVNSRFLKVVDLRLMHRLLERHADGLRGLDLRQLDGDAVAARQGLTRFFAGPDEDYPEGLIADLHRIAEVGTSRGFEILRERAANAGIRLELGTDQEDETGPVIDAKQAAIICFLDHPQLFTTIANLWAIEQETSLAEFAGEDEGVEPLLDQPYREAFKAAAAELFKVSEFSSYCDVDCYPDGDEINLVVTHGTPIRTIPVVEGRKERVLSYRPAGHAVLRYTPATGRIKIGGIAQSRRKQLAQAFARTMLRRPAFFDAASADELYTLRPIERLGDAFTFDHAFDPGIRSVRIVGLQIRRQTSDGERKQESWSLSLQNEQNALARLFALTRGLRLDGQSLSISQVTFRVAIDTGRTRAVSVTVKLKPPGTLIFRRQWFEGRIMTLLERNELCVERVAADPAVAAE